MTAFADKLHWPLIDTLNGLLAQLDGVVARPYGAYSHIANPPCHASGSKASFQLGPAPGGVYVNCWNCNRGARNGYIDRIEDALRCRIQAVYSDGRLRWETDGRPRTPAPTPPPKPPEPPHAIPGPITLNALCDAAVWYVVGKVGDGKGPYTTDWEGDTIGWRQCVNDRIAPGGDGVAFARNGGWYTDDRQRRIRAMPHRERNAVIANIARLQDESCRPALSLAGSVAHPFPFPLAVVDCDYKPGLDETPGASEPARNRIRQALTAAGWAVFSSSSGNGFHAFAAMTDLGGITSFQRKFRVTDALVVELFLPGARRGLVPLLDRQLCETAWDAPLPEFTFAAIGKLVGDAVQTPNQCRQCRRPMDARKLVDGLCSDCATPPDDVSVNTPPVFMDLPETLIGCNCERCWAVERKVAELRRQRGM